MKRNWMLAVAIVGFLPLGENVRAESDHRIGMGVNASKDGVSWMATYQYAPAAILKLEADLEVFPESFQGADGAAYAPEAFLILGSTIYCAAGIGILYADGGFPYNPFYTIRAGLDSEVVERFYLDLSISYRFAEVTNPSDKDEDTNESTIMLGAAIRFRF